MAALGLSWGMWDPVPLRWELGVLPTGPPGKSTSDQLFTLFFSNFLSALSFCLLFFPFSFSLSPILSSRSYFLLFSVSLLLSILFLSFHLFSLLSLLFFCLTLPISFSLYLFFLLPLFLSPFLSSSSSPSLHLSLPTLLFFPVYLFFFLQFSSMFEFGVLIR